MDHPFTYQHYREILLIAQRNNYKFVNYTASLDLSSVNQKFVLLRHDIDFSLEKALLMARLEAEYGVKSTYFIMLTSDFYNIMSASSQKILHEIKFLGHSFGLHFDPVAYNINDKEQLSDYIKREAEFLSRILDFPIQTISFHRPSQEILDGNLLFSPLINTYENRFFTDIKYISDSRRMWKSSCVCEFLKQSTFKHIQLLIHPIWWNDENYSFDQTIIKHVNSSITKIHDELVRNIRDFPAKLKPSICKLWEETNGEN